MEGILAWNLLSSAPARVAESIHHLLESARHELKQTDGLTFYIVHMSDSTVDETEEESERTGVQKFVPAWFPFENARASVLTCVATWCTKSSWKQNT